MESVDAFFSIDTPASERVAVLTDSTVSYIVAQGEDIQTLTDRRFIAEAAGALDLVPMFAQGQVTVYGIQTW
jgi:purine nucleoside permease